MNFPIFRRVLNSDLTCTQRMIMVVILNHSNSKGTSWPSQETIAKQSGLSRKSVNENLAFLEKIGWLKRENGAGRNHILTVAECNPQLQQVSPTVTLEAEAHCNSGLQQVSPTVTGDVTQGYNDVTEGYTKYPVTPIQPPIEQPNGTNTKAERQKPDRSKAKGTEQELMDYAQELGVERNDGSYLFDNWESNGWKTGSGPIKDWRAAMRKWVKGGWLPSQKRLTQLNNMNTSRPSPPKGSFL